MDPSEIQITSHLPKPLDEGTSPELNEYEKGIVLSDAEFPSVEVEVEQLPHISSDDEKRSNSESSKDYKPPNFYDNPYGSGYFPPSEACHYFTTAIYHPDFFSSPPKRKFSEKEKKLSENDEERYAENDRKSSDNGETFSENDERYAENEESSNYSEEKLSENDEERYEENDENSSGNERSSGHVDTRNFSRAEERKHHSSKSSTVPFISETNDKVIITLKAVRKKTIIRILDNEAKISCEVKYSQKRKYEMSDNGKWVHERKFTKICKDVIITPKVPKTETSKKRSEDVSFCYPNGSDDSDSDKENRFDAGSSAGKDLGKNEDINPKDSNDSDSDKENRFDAGSSAGKDLGKNEDVKLDDNNTINKCIPSLTDNDGETSVCTMEGISNTGPSPSPSKKRAMNIVEKGRKKIRLNKEDSVDEEMKSSSEEEKRNS